MTRKALPWWHFPLWLVTMGMVVGGALLGSRYAYHHIPDENMFMSGLSLLLIVWGAYYNGKLSAQAEEYWK